MAMKLHTLDELMDRDIGPIGTPKRMRLRRSLLLNFMTIM